MTASGPVVGWLASAEDALAAPQGLSEQVAGDLTGQAGRVDALGAGGPVGYADAREVTRQLVQDHLDLRALTEWRVPGCYTDTLIPA
jgi:hypothetical protein